MSEALSYRTRGGVAIRRNVQAVDGKLAVEKLARELDTARGVLLSSSYDYPGRYTRWDLGFVNPLLEFTTREHRFAVRALNRRGEVLVPAVFASLRAEPAVESFAIDDTTSAKSSCINKK